MEEISVKERAYRAALYEVDGIGPARFKVLVKYFGSAEAIWKAKEREIAGVGLAKDVLEEFGKRKKLVEPERHLVALAKLGVRVVLVEDEEYPRLLGQIDNPPQVLFSRGCFREEDSKALAVVGTRKPTAYGREVTRRLVEELCAAGLTIVSGLARGIDGTAHRAALESGGRTIAVLGGGVDRIYPPEHAGLARKISEHGVVVSEFAPGKLPVPGNFPARNRIISGLSLGVLVIEGASQSGTKITASLAAEQGREVFAVPGPINSRQSQAPLELLKLGAKPVAAVSDILEELNLMEKNRESNQISRAAVLDNLSGEEKKIVEALADGQLHIDEIVKKTGGKIAEVSAILTILELRGAVRHLGGMVYCL